MITPDQPASVGANNEICVAREALQIDGVAPAMGEEVEYVGRGRVVRMDDGHAYLETTQVNGEPVIAQAGELVGGDIEAMARSLDEAAT